MCVCPRLTNKSRNSDFFTRRRLCGIVVLTRLPLRVGLHCNFCYGTRAENVTRRTNPHTGFGREIARVHGAWSETMSTDLSQEDFVEFVTRRPHYGWITQRPMFSCEFHYTTTICIRAPVRTLCFYIGRAVMEFSEVFLWKTYNFSICREITPVRTANDRHTFSTSTPSLARFQIPNRYGWITRLWFLFIRERKWCKINWGGVKKVDFNV